MRPTKPYLVGVVWMVLSKGHLLPAKFVIHTVGPVWRGGSCGEPNLLRSCYEQSLKIAGDFQLESIAVPGISTGCMAI